MCNQQYFPAISLLILVVFINKITRATYYYHPCNVILYSNKILKKVGVSMYRCLSLVMVAIAILLLPVSAAHAAEPFDITYCGSGAVTIIVKSKALAIASVDAKGIAIGNDNNSNFHNLTWHGVGFMVAQGGKRSWQGYATIVDTDGSTIIVTTTITDLKIMMGTGKWQGITGQEKGWLIAKGRPVTEGTIQNCRRVKGTFILPPKAKQ